MNFDSMCKKDFLNFSLIIIIFIILMLISLLFLFNNYSIRKSTQSYSISFWQLHYNFKYNNKFKNKHKIIDI